MCGTRGPHMPKGIVRYSIDMDTLVYQPVTDSIASGSSEKTHHWLRKLTIKSDRTWLVNNQIEWGRRRCCWRFLLVATCMLDLSKIKKTLNLSHIYAKPTKSKSDHSKNNEIFSKSHKIFTGSKRKPLCFCRI